MATVSPEDSFRPRYREIEQAIRQRLARLKPGAELPSDAQLCEEFAVSRMTARHAMHRLAQEGLVFRVRGRGTFVGEPPTHRRANSLLSFS
ncbi:MAG: GntR family transcriptional regulator, partial [Chloroflexi bacterium]